MFLVLQKCSTFKSFFQQTSSCVLWVTNRLFLCLIFILANFMLLSMVIWWFDYSWYECNQFFDYKTSILYLIRLPLFYVWALMLYCGMHTHKKEEIRADKFYIKLIPIKRSNQMTACSSCSPTKMLFSILIKPDLTGEGAAATTWAQIFSAVVNLWHPHLFSNKSRAEEGQAERIYMPGCFYKNAMNI